MISIGSEAGFSLEQIHVCYDYFRTVMTTGFCFVLWSKNDFVWSTSLAFDEWLIVEHPQKQRNKSCIRPVFSMVTGDIGWWPYVSAFSFVICLNRCLMKSPLYLGNFKEENINGILDWDTQMTCWDIGLYNNRIINSFSRKAQMPIMK